MMRYCKTVVISLGLLSVVAGPGSLALAHSTATGVVKERMDLMNDLADAMKAMGAMFKGEVAFEPALVFEKASVLVDHATLIPDVTPAGSDNHPSETLPEVWQAWDAYVDSAVELADEGAKLMDIARNGADENAMRAQYVTVGKTCGTCHDRFRKPKD